MVASPSIAVAASPVSARHLSACWHNMNQNNATIRIARTAADIEKALHVRWLGYRKYASFAKPELEDLDRGANCTILLAEDDTGKPIGTIRILDRRHGPIELEKFLDVDSLLPGSKRSIAEATRLSVPHTPSARRLKLLFWKAYYLLCVQRSIDYMLVSVRPGAAQVCNRLLFSKADGGTYSHAVLSDLPHESFWLHVPTALHRFESHKHPLLPFFAQTEHPEINFNR